MAADAAECAGNFGYILVFPVVSQRMALRGYVRAAADCTGFGGVYPGTASGFGNRTGIYAAELLVFVCRRADIYYGGDPLLLPFYASYPEENGGRTSRRRNLPGYGCRCRRSCGCLNP